MSPRPSSRSFWSSNARWPRGAVILALAAATACSDSDPTGSTCTVSAVAVEGLPDQLAAFEEVTVTADVTQTDCTGLEVTWSGSEGLDIGTDGTVSSPVLGGPFEVTASVGGVEASAEVTVVSPPAVPDSRWALAWHENATVDNYTIDQSGYTYASSTGGDIVVNRTGPGAYTLRFTGLAADAGQRQAVAVSAYGSSEPSRCHLLSVEEQGADLEVLVQCFDLSGAPLDSRLDVLVVPAGSTNGRSAFGVTPSEDGGLVLAESAHNSQGEAIHLERVGIGHYEVTFDGLFRDTVAPTGSEIFHVTSYGEGVNWCKIGGWEPVDTENIRLTVYCFTPSGSRADARFSALMLEEERPGGHRLGYVRANDPGAGAYTPDLDSNYNSSGATNTAIRRGAGDYSSIWTGLGRPSNDVAETNLVTAIGGDATFCKVRNWGGTATNIDCYAPDGTRQDTEYAAIWIE